MGLFAGTRWEIPPTCDACGKLQVDCRCPRQTPAPQWLPPEQQRVRVWVEKRKAKRLVTVVAGLAASESDLPGLLTRLQTACGAGGSREGDDLILQGDHLDRVSRLLREIGYCVGD